MLKEQPDWDVRPYQCSERLQHETLHPTQIKVGGGGGAFAMISRLWATSTGKEVSSLCSSPGPS